MCGIFGILSPILPENRIIISALNSIKHRGPDDEGYLFVNIIDNSYRVALGKESCSELKDKYTDVLDIDTSEYHLLLANRRLAIIDLSPKGHQPMCNTEGDLWITYNGEIFNYKDLRMELKLKGYIFHSNTDTEVILAAYSEWGEACVNKFNGQWAFCIYDTRTKRLFCSRDRFGIKPFYYWYDDKYFAFASEIKALLKLPFIGRELNKPMISEFVLFAMLDHSEETLYKEIYQLLPSHNLTIDLEGLNPHINKYYELSSNNNRERYYAKKALKYADDIRDLLIDSVRIRLISDVPVGSCLSGGLDSSSIVVIINKLLKEGGIAAEKIGEKQKTFTVSYDDPSVDEKIHADEVIRHTNVNSFFIFPTAEGLWKELHELLFHQDGLCFSTNVYAGRAVMDLASRHVKVVLNGQGGDEIFGGYPRYELVYVSEIMKRTCFKDFFKFLLSKSTLYGMKHCLDSVLRGSYLAFVPDRLQVFLFKQKNKHMLRYNNNLLGNFSFNKKSFNKMVERVKSLNYMLWCEVTRDYLPQLLHYDDRNASAFSIENRVPFTDHRLVEYLSGISSVYKLYNGWSKWLLRLAMRDLLPEKILRRKDKKGFPTPEKSWIRHKASPMPLLMSQYGIKKYDYSVWRLHLAEKLMKNYE